MKLIALDVGSKRIGVAKADTKVRIAVPYGVIEADGSELTQIASFARVYGTNLFVIGLPRNNKGVETAQSLYVRNFAKALKEYLPDAKIRFQDESLTSVEAEEHLKARKKRYAKGEIDAEAAAIILQDFLENFTERAVNAEPGEEDAPADSDQSAAATAATVAAVGTAATVGELTHKSAKAKKKKSHVVRNIILSLLALIILAGAGSYIFYHANLAAVSPNTDCTCSDTGGNCGIIEREPCKNITFTINEGESVQTVADNLAAAGLTRNSLVFQLHYYFNYRDDSIKAGDYDLNKTLSVDELIQQFIKGGKDDVFSFTILPGETISEVKKKLVKQGYATEEVEAAFNKSYNHPVLAGKPADASLEGYIFGETYEFYTGESVENIITTTLDQLYKVVQDNNLEAAFKEQDLSLYEGITLSSVVQKEAKTAKDQAIVAQVFYTRLASGISLGSDVTAQYAADLVDPDRTTYTDNASVINIDSPYNTRRVAGLPYGPVCNPGEQALKATAHPADTSYLFFLTGDDGVMYYSNTAAEHNQNIASHCQQLCNTQL